MWGIFLFGYTINTRQTYFACRIATKLFSLQHMTGQNATRLLIKGAFEEIENIRGESYKI